MPDKIVPEKTLQERADEMNALLPVGKRITEIDVALEDINKSEDMILLCEYQKIGDNLSTALNLTKQIYKSALMGREVHIVTTYDLENPIINADGKISGHNFIREKILIK